MIATDCVFRPRQYTGDTTPPDVMEDVSRYQNVGVFKGAGEPDWVRLVSGLWVMSYDGSDDVLNITHHASLKPLVYSVSMWFRAETDVTAYRDLITSTSDPDGNKQGYHLRIDQTTGLIFGRSGNGSANKSVASSTAVNDETWHQVALTNDLTNVSLYIDGALITQTAWAGIGAIFYDTNAVRLGVIYGYYYGYMSTLRIENYVIDVHKIYDRYQAERGRFGV